MYMLHQTSCDWISCTQIENNLNKEISISPFLYIILIFSMTNIFVYAVNIDKVTICAVVISKESEWFLGAQ